MPSMLHGRDSEQRAADILHQMSYGYPQGSQLTSTSSQNLTRQAIPILRSGGLAAPMNNLSITEEDQAMAAEMKQHSQLKYDGMTKEQIYAKLVQEEEEGERRKMQLSSMARTSSVGKTAATKKKHGSRSNSKSPKRYR